MWQRKYIHVIFLGGIKIERINLHIVLCRFGR